MIANKISRVTAILYRLRNIFPNEILPTLYNSGVQVGHDLDIYKYMVVYNSG